MRWCTLQHAPGATQPEQSQEDEPVTGGASGGAGAAATTSSAAASAAPRPSAPHASAAVHSATTASGCARLRVDLGLHPSWLA